jgi:hypothetical protein
MQIRIHKKLKERDVKEESFLASRKSMSKMESERRKATGVQKMLEMGRKGF